MSDKGIQIRQAVCDDAESLLELKLLLDGETRFMMLEPGERQETAAEVAVRLQEIERRDNCVLLVADDGSSLLGYIEADGGRFCRNRHSAHVVIGVRQSESGRGIGTALLRELNVWAEESGVHRLELTVMAHNSRAIALYEKAGYAVEGGRRDSLFVEGRYVDELALGRITGGSRPD